MNTTDPTHWTLAQVARALAAGDVSALEVTTACLERIQAWQPSRRSFIHIDTDGALAAARRSDALRAQGGPLGPLHGVPLAHKDMFYRRGHVCTAGSLIRRDWVADHTATVLERLDAAGALSLGALNMSEFAGGPTGHNPHYGDCGNAYHPDYMPGGSSSGSGSAVGARLVYGSLSSDTGASIRLPAAANGVVGLKATYGRVSRYGAVPRSWTLDHVGLIARTAEDCALLLGVVAGPDPQDPTASQRPVDPYLDGLARSMRGLRIGVPDFSTMALDPEVAAALDAALDVYLQAGAQRVDVTLPDLRPLFLVAETIIKSEAASLHGPWLQSRREDYSDLLRSRTEAGMLIPAARYIDALRLRPLLTTQFLDTVMQGIDVLFMPVLPFPTPTLADCDTEGRGTEVLKVIGRLTQMVRPMNLLGLPALSVPCGLCQRGLPLAFQLVGHPFQEALLLAAAHRYQQDGQTLPPPSL